jgi:predicted ATPase
VSARLDQIDEPDRAVLQAAAVLGDTVWPDAVAALLGAGPGGVHAALRRLERRDLLVRRPSRTIPDQPEYAFSQAVIRQVAYLRLPRAVRVDHHRKVAEWLSAIATSSLSDVDVERARQWLAASDLACALHRDAEPYRVAACHALAAAARAASRQGRALRARALADRALRLWPAAGDTAERVYLERLAVAARGVRHGAAAQALLNSVTEDRAAGNGLATGAPAARAIVARTCRHPGGLRAAIQRSQSGRAGIPRQSDVGIASLRRVARATRGLGRSP